MSVKIASTIAPESEEMRHAFCSVLMELAENNKDIVVLDADLMGAMGTKAFAKKYPEQTVNCGIQEANMIGVAAGLSAVGKIPFAHTFAPFATRRVCDQVFMSCAYARNNVKIIGSDPGITAQLNGGTHMPFEDMGIMRGIPEVTVLEPTDITMLRWMLKEMAATFGVQYMRLVRKNCAKVYEEGTTFRMGEAVQLCDGTDVTIIASGYCVAEAYKAAAILKEAGVSARVFDMFCWKPIDRKAIIKAAQETGAIVTAENHNVLNGLGAAVSEVVVRNHPVPVEMIGVQDEFGEVGPLEYLAERFKLNASYIVEAAQKAIARKA